MLSAASNKKPAQRRGSSGPEIYIFRVDSRGHRPDIGRGGGGMDVRRLPSGNH